ncbi:MAG: transcription-repair coupling factor [Clostridiales bacterium]|jgi:transcription-repair coupling factor (superfamily II helicase)|nr:transcription-repair coupling factor [Clostridiales bacterium]
MSANGLFDLLLELPGYQTLSAAVREHKTPVLATGVIDSQKCHVCAGLLQASLSAARPAVIVTHSELKAREMEADMRRFLRDDVKLYPSKDIIFYAADVKSADIIKQRFAVMQSLFEGKNACVILSSEALLDRLTPPDIFRAHILSLASGDVFSIEELSKRLVYMGYERVSLVEAPGHFAVRGGILDVYTTIYENALRIDFYGDEVDSIRLLDTYSQRSVESIASAQIYPMRELVYDGETLERAVHAIASECETACARAEKNGLSEEAGHLRRHMEGLLEKLRSELSFPGVDEYIQYFYPEDVNLFDYLPQNTLLFFDEPARAGQHVETVLAEFTESIQNRILKGIMLPSQTDMVFSYARILTRANAFDTVLLSSVTQTVKDFRLRDIAGFTVKSTPSFQYVSLAEDLAFWRKEQYRILLLTDSKYQGQKLAEEIVGMGYTARYFEDLEGAPLEKATVTIARGALRSGFEYPLIKAAIVSVLKTAEEKKKKSRTRQKASKIESFTDLRVGDYVVHDNHGIGIYEGIEQITIDGVSRDYLKLAYADGGHLYVQTSQMDMIQKYIGGEGVHARLNKLGGSEWTKSKSRARKAVAILAQELVDLYAKRQSSKGFVFAKDTVWQKEFEEMFPFEETEDQLRAIEDVKCDMETGKVMDRLICGDVGYGKTEVAIRAAFKAAQDGKQVAYLVPTTILAQQHYNTFRQRMRDFPINVEMLSRFRTAKEQRLTIARLRDGLCDIVIGTHRILSADMKFHNLGLVIVDEEQRFGVGHKEKLKSLRENVNVLTLTATPIPRTLHMSLTGIRDMSMLEEPPQERRPVQTYVMEYNAEFVRDAISRELARGGQVYYLHNRVQNIAEEASRVAALAPDAKVAYAHGQMSERELENIMLDFIEGAVQVLVCTTIIETGLDIPNVNTIIIQSADCMGLSQLYQLRGRVGRSNRLAYAYLMYRKDKVLREDAEKRLQTIREFTEFGSGFKIAMRDLEIRGAGNLLGSEQHGHMDAIGYDMYCKLLSEAVSQIRGDQPAEEFETFIDITINAFIPSNFIQDEEQKLEIYKKISLISGQQDYYDVQEEIEDRYGDIPKSAANLLTIALLKADAHKAGVLSIVQKPHGIIVTFKGDANVDPLRLMKEVEKRRKNLLFAQAPSPCLTYKLASAGVASALKEIRDILRAVVTAP